VWGRDTHHPWLHRNARAHHTRRIHWLARRACCWHLLPWPNTRAFSWLAWCLTIRSSRPRVVASAACFCATLARVCRHATGRLNSGVRRQKSILLLCCGCFSFTGFVCSALRRVSRRVVLRLPQVARSGLAYVTGQWRVRLFGLFTSGRSESVRGAPSLAGFGLSAKASVWSCSRVPTRLTIRSSRRRISASLKLTVGRAILALHCCGRRGLTQALAFIFRWSCVRHEFPIRHKRRPRRFYCL